MVNQSLAGLKGHPPPEISAPRDPAKVVKSAKEMQGKALLTLLRSSIVPGVPVLLTRLRQKISWSSKIYPTN